MNVRDIGTGIFAVWLLGIADGHCYDIITHAKMSEAAFLASSSSTILNALGLSAYSKLAPDSVGLTDVNEGTAIRWVREGAVREDGDSRCDTRVRNHFYNPLNHAGLFTGIIQGSPSPDWALEDRNENADQRFSYADAKRYFWEALRPASEIDRQRDLALTFRSLGHVVHLVQDAAQPQHTRNDVHAGLQCPWTFGLLGPKSAYESHVDAIAQQIPYSGYPNVVMSAPRQYWDDGYGRGIAEFSNRSFVSWGTNFRGPPDDLKSAPGFPLPDGTGAIEVAEDISTLDPGTQLRGVMRFISTPYEDRYLGVTGRNPRASVHSVFTEEMTAASLLHRYTLNRFTYEAARELLVPRAVGYSAGLIDHFFRGRLAISAPDSFAYAVTSYTGDSGSFTKMKMKIRNVTGGEETDRGTVQAIVRYRFGGPVDPLVVPWDYPGEARYAVSAPLDTVVTREDQQVEFDFAANPIPASISDVSLVVAYRGPLIGPQATEQDAIAFGGKDLYEPELIAVGNAMDYDCYRDALYDTDGLAADRRDLNRDGQQDLFGPWSLTGNYFLLRAPTAPFLLASSANFNFRVPFLASARYTRFVAIQDSQRFRLRFHADDGIDESTGRHWVINAQGDFWGSINRFIDRSDGTVHEYNYGPPARFRTVLAHHGGYHTNVAVSSSSVCAQALAGVSRPMIEVEGATE